MTLDDAHGVSADERAFFRPFGQSRDGDDEVAVRPDGKAWKHTGLLVCRLTDGQTRAVDTGPDEYLVLPLSGGGSIEIVTENEAREELAGRRSVFHGSADCAYLPRGGSYLLRAVGEVQVALCFARAKADLPLSVVRAHDVPIELRGAGNCSRQVHNFGTPEVLSASSIIACEVITPAGNWSSYPPHKHDEHRPGEESELEEIYYFQTCAEADAPAEADPLAYCCISGTVARPIDVRVPVRSGDVLLVPHGWHGPAMAPPGYHLYYLNVMAGPHQERAWLIRDHPEHTWVRDTWAAQSVDARLPFGSSQGDGR